MNKADTNGKSIAENIAWNSIGSLTYVVGNWVITVLVVLLSTNYSASGDLALAMAVGNLVSTIVQFKVRPIQVSDLEGRHTSGDYVGLRIISCAIAVIFALFYSIATIPAESYAPVAAYCVFKLSDSFVDVFHGIDQKYDRLDYAGKSQIFRGVGIVAFFSAGMYFTGDLTFSILLMTLITVAVVAVYDIPRSARYESLVPRFDFNSLKRLFGICTPGFVASLLCTLVVSYSRQVYGLAYGGELLGIFAATATPAVIVQALAGYMYSPLLVPIARAWSAHGVRSIERFVLRFFLLLFGLIVCSAIGSMLLGQFALNLVYGAKVASYYTLLPLILVSTGITAGMFFVLDLLVILGAYRGTILSCAASFIACFIMSRPMVSHFDMNGISLTVIVSYLIGIAVGGIFMRMAFKAKRNEAAQNITRC